MVTEHTPFIYGIHDLCPDNVLDGQGVIVHAARLGHDPDDHHSVNLSDRAETVICRIQHGWGSEGTLPAEYLMPDYLLRLKNFVQGSSGVNLWITWNEPNHSQERPNGTIITPDYAAAAYLDMRDVIRSCPGHEGDLVLVGAIAPWNLESGDWLEYMRSVYAVVWNDMDGSAIHAYTHGAHPDLIFSDEVQHDWYWHFRTYRQQILTGLSPAQREKPIYITETNQGGHAWVDYNTGWVQNAYQEIDEWNKGAGPGTIRALVLYRWAYDKWKIEDKSGVRGDLLAAQQKHYTWTGNDPEPPEDTLIKNAGLEPPYFVRDNQPEVEIAQDWNYGYWQDDNDGSSKRPEYKPETTLRVLEGTAAQKWFWTYAKGEAWIWQNVPTEPGKWYELSAHVYVWSSSENDNNQSVKPGKMWCRLGANPWGDGNARSLATEYGGAVVDNYDRWVKLTTVFQAKAGQSAIFLWASPEHAVHHNDVYWDVVSLKEWSSTEPPVEPPVDPPEPGECNALTYDETVLAVEAGVKKVLSGICAEVG